MKKLLVGLMMIAMGLLLMSPVASAYPVSAGDQIIINWGIGNANSGGSFNISKTDQPANILFDTFCLERNEYFSPGSSYYIVSITNAAINGGYSGQETTSNDPISFQTAFLYYQWATGGIDNTVDNANALQLAIWSLEGEMAINPITLTAEANQYILDAANANGYYGVAVMNLYDADGNAKQSQLTLVPEPASMLLFGLGLLGLAGLRRRFKK